MSLNSGSLDQTRQLLKVVKLEVDQINEKTNGLGVIFINKIRVLEIRIENVSTGANPILRSNSSSQLIDILGSIRSDNSLIIDTISEKTSGVGITIDGLLIKDGIGDLVKGLLLGASNAKYIGCSLISLPANTSNVKYMRMMTTLGFVTNQVTGTVYVSYNLHLPPVFGALKLYVKNIKVGLASADVNNYITAITVNGIGTDMNNVVIQDNLDDKNSVGEVIYALSGVDASESESITINIVGSTDTQFALQINTIALECYYA